MVKSAERRAAKYSSKIDADVQRTRILALKGDMVTNQAPAAASLAALEGEIKKILEGNETPPWGYQIPMLLNVARRLQALMGKFSGGTFQQEAAAFLDQCDTKGVGVYDTSKSYLTYIAAYFNVTWPLT